MSSAETEVYYRGDNDVHVYDIGNHRQIHVVPYNEDIAKIYLTDNYGTKLHMPDNITLSTLKGAKVPTHRDMFLITWLHSYVLSVGGRNKISISTERRQALRAAKDVTLVEIKQ